MRIKVSSWFYPLFDVRDRYLVLCGGAGSGKSEFAGRKIFKRCMEEGGHKFLILRKVRVTLRESVISVMLTILKENEIEYSYNKTDRIIKFTNPQGKLCEILFDGLDDKEKIKSIKGITSIWMEEATEFTKEDFMQIDLRLRGETEFYKQIILSFNPDEAQGAWLKEEFFDEKKESSYIHESTIEDNPIKEVRDEYITILERLRDDTYYKIYRLGKWALAKGIIYDWDVVGLPTKDESWYDEIWYGGDFGYSVDPAALVKIYRKANEFWIEEILYKKGLTNPALADEMKTDLRVNVEAYSYWDSAEPKSIQELYDNGINALPASKGADSVRVGIDFLKSLKIHIVEGSQNIKDERKSYKWKEDKDGNTLPIPVEFKNHAMDGTRYGIYTHLKDRCELDVFVI